MGSKKPKPASDGISAETRAEYLQLEKTRRQLESKALAMQTKEMGLLRKQLTAQTVDYKTQLGFIRQQIAASDQAAQTYSQQLNQQTQLSAMQKQQAENEKQRSGMEASIQRSNLAATQLRQYRTLRQRANIQRGFFNGNNGL